MSASRDHILAEIRRIAAENGGASPGMQAFATATKIRRHEWMGKYWRKWGEALREAGVSPNQLTQAVPEEELLDRLCALATSLRRVPTDADLRMQRHQDATFPSHTTFSRLGHKPELVTKLRAFASTGGNEAVVGYCDELRTVPAPSSVDSGSESRQDRAGYVYLVRHGSRREFKIGKTYDPLRRQGEVALELPGEMKPIHVIETDDPAGVEKYWHRRFSGKSLRGEWFALDATDVRAFKRWRNIF